MKMKEIRKALLQGKIRISSHTFKRLEKRGYTKKDLIACIMRGEITNIQLEKGSRKAQIEGVDTDGLPMVVIIGKDDTGKGLFAIVTSFPPIKSHYRRVI